MLILWVSAVPHLQPDAAHDASQTHGPLSPVVNLFAAEGEKLRLGGWLLPGAFAPVVGASIRALLLKLPIQCPVMSGLHYSPVSFAPFLDSDSFDWIEDPWIPFQGDEEPITPLLWWLCQDALTGTRSNE